MKLDSTSPQSNLHCRRQQADQPPKWSHPRDSTSVLRFATSTSGERSERAKKWARCRKLTWGLEAPGSRHQLMLLVQYRRRSAVAARAHAESMNGSIDSRGRPAAAIARALYSNINIHSSMNFLHTAALKYMNKNIQVNRPRQYSL